jgi:hypothetical protein
MELPLTEPSLIYGAALGLLVFGVLAFNDRIVDHLLVGDSAAPDGPDDLE